MADDTGTANSRRYVAAPAGHEGGFERNGHVALGELPRRTQWRQATSAITAVFGVPMDAIAYEREAQHERGQEHGDSTAQRDEGVIFQRADGQWIGQITLDNGKRKTLQEN